MVFRVFFQFGGVEESRTPVHSILLYKIYKFS